MNGVDNIISAWIDRREREEQTGHKSIHRNRVRTRNMIYCILRIVGETPPHRSSEIASSCAVAAWSLSKGSELTAIAGHGSYFYGSLAGAAAVENKYVYLAIIIQIASLIE